MPWTEDRAMMVSPGRPLHVDALGIWALGAQLRRRVDIPLHPAIRTHPHDFTLRIGWGLLGRVVLHVERGLLDVRVVIHVERGLLDVGVVLRVERDLLEIRIVFLDVRVILCLGL